VVKDIIKEDELDPIRNNIETGVDIYARQQNAAGKPAPLCGEEPVEPRCAAISVQSREFRTAAGYMVAASAVISTISTIFPPSFAS